MLFTCQYPAAILTVLTLYCLAGPSRVRWALNTFRLDYLLYRSWTERQTAHRTAYLATMKQRILEYVDALGVAIIFDLFNYNIHKHTGLINLVANVV